MYEDYLERTQLSKRLFERAKKVFAGGVNHNARYYEPYPLFVAAAKGPYVWDEDGNRYVDFWMGHMALILGHAPKAVVEALKDQMGRGTHYGMASRLSVELGEEIQRCVPCAEKMRFCNSGAEATMYMVRLARAYTKKRVVIKMAGGWHGYNTELNKGVHAPFDRSESEGILAEEQAHVVTVKFNDLDAVQKAVRLAGGDLATILLEPVLGSGGCIPAEPGYLKGLRELADGTGALLTFDEIITGFRVALGGAQERYKVKPDLSTLGKVVGGGLPIGVVCGREEIISMADPSRRRNFVSIGGGTFSENPLSMTAGLATVRFLRKNSRRVYPNLEKAGVMLRKQVDDACEREGVQASTTGLGSLFLTHFGPAPKDAEESAAEGSGVAKEYALYLMTRGIFILPGHASALSTAHSNSNIQRLARETGEFFRKRTGKRTKGRAKVTA